MPHTVAIIQSRIASTRFPGKALHPLAGAPLTEHIIRRLEQVNGLEGIVLALPDAADNRPLADLGERCGARVYQGPEEDVLQRFIEAAASVNAENILRVCGDNPLFDPNLADLLVREHVRSKADYTVSPDPIPIGAGTEMVRSSALEKIAQATREPGYREHVITYFRDFPESFSLHHVAAPPYLLNRPHRLTVDTEPDIRLMEAIHQHFHAPTGRIDLEEVLQYLDTHPDIAGINSRVAQKDWRETGS